MLAGTRSVALVGTEAHLVEVEVDVTGGGLPAFKIVGLPTKSVREAEQRTRSAIDSWEKNSWPSGRIVANLAPGALRKDGTHFDLALALGVLAGAKRLPTEPLTEWVTVGELALDGSVRSVRGALAAAIACKRAGAGGLICPARNAAEAAAVEGVEVIPVESLSECIQFIRGRWQPGSIEVHATETELPADDMSEVKGHEEPKRALEIAAAGGHNLLMIGPPGSGKTMLARRLPGILPEMSTEESLDVTLNHSVAGVLPAHSSLVERRPFRSPHHNVSMAGLIGGGSGLARPGEVSLADHGVLFLDELPLYRREVLESLRAPIEEGLVRVARSAGVVTFPCRFSLIAAMNPCPCGHEGDRKRACTCSEVQKHSYRSKLSGPLLDRIDLQTVMDRPSKEELLGEPSGDPSNVIRARVEGARRMQLGRYGTGLFTNASAPRSAIARSVALSSDARRTLGDAIETVAVTGRGVDRVLRLARTIADLDQREDVTEDDIGLALSFRISMNQKEAA